MTINTNIQAEKIRVTLPIFEGPLDLLLYLIKKNDLNIYDIPVSMILEQYTSYLDALKELNIDLAGEFLVTASEMAHIKSRILLSKKSSEEEEEGDDPRASLMARLIEYQKYKRAAQWLAGRPRLNHDFYRRPDVRPWLNDVLRQEEDDALQIEPFTLVRVFQQIVSRIPKGSAHEVSTERVSVTDRIYEVLDMLKSNEQVDFETLFSTESTRIDMVVTFLAILEMARLKMIRISQASVLGTLWVTRRMEVASESVVLDSVAEYQNSPTEDQ